jgi:hypothetical protein
VPSARGGSVPLRGDMAGLTMSEVRVEVQRDCLGGERIVELVLPAPVTEAGLDAIEGAATRQILRSLPRPFYRVDVPGSFLVSGILGDPRVRFTVRFAVRDRALEVCLQAAHRILAAR